MNLEALQDNIILRPIMAGNVTPGGIVLPNKGTFEDGAVIISIGPDVDRLVVGDIVVRPDPPRITVNDDDTGEIFLICAEVDILAKMLPDPPDPPEIKPITDPAQLLMEATNVPDETEEMEEQEQGQEKVEGSEEGQIHSDGVQEDSMGSLLPVHPVEGLHKDNGDEGVG